MAITQNDISNPGAWYGNSNANNVTVSPQLFKGQILYVEKSYPMDAFTPIHPDQVKHELCQRMVEEMFKAGYIEFTREDNVYLRFWNCRARAILLPSTDVFYLRNEGIIK